MYVVWFLLIFSDPLTEYIVCITMTVNVYFSCTCKIVFHAGIDISVSPEA